LLLLIHNLCIDILSSSETTPSPFFFCRHSGQPPNLIHIQPRSFGHTVTVVLIGSAKDRRLAILDTLDGVAQMADNISDQVISIGIDHDTAVKIGRLDKIIVG